jgi:L-lactate dehydrogenase complex protein LldG
MTSRERILSRVKQNQTGTAVVRAHVDPVSDFDIATKFKETLISIGGRVIEVNEESQVYPALLKLFPTFEQLNTIIPTLGNITQPPQAFASLNIAVIRGEFGVAENGSIWVTHQSMGDRVLPFICEHLVLIISQSSLVANMHEAYERIGKSSYDFATFIAGPSKTADIEQSLVLGAHGAKTMTVMLIG